MAFPDESPTMSVGVGVAAPVNIVASKPKPFGGGWSALTAGGVSKSRSGDNGILDIPQLEDMEADAVAGAGAGADGDGPGSDSDSSVDSDDGKNNAVAPVTRAPVPVAVAPIAVAVKRAEGDMVLVKQRLVILYGDVLDALEVTVWEGCNVLE